MQLKWNRNLAYYLGYLYSDGHLDKYRASIEITKKDADVIEPFILDSGLQFTIYERKRKNRQPQKAFWYNDIKFCEYLNKNMNYGKKSLEPPIIDDIPDIYIKYFMLGLIDGDGCFYISEDKKVKQFYITSSYDYNWDLIEKLFDNLGIVYTINRVVNNKEKNHKSSYIRFTKYDSHKKLYRYLYPSGYEMGLKRKFDKATEIIDNKPLCEPNRSPLILKEIMKDIVNMNYTQIAEKYNCSDRKVRRFAKKHKIGTYSED